MIDRIKLFLYFFSTENEFQFFYSGVLKTHKAGEDLYFKFNIKNKKSFILLYDKFMKSELVYTEILKSGIPNDS